MDVIFGLGRASFPAANPQPLPRPAGFRHFLAKFHNTTENMKMYDIVRRDLALFQQRK
jgi:hypothetical protein